METIATRSEVSYGGNYEGKEDIVMDEKILKEALECLIEQESREAIGVGSINGHSFHNIYLNLSIRLEILRII